MSLTSREDITRSIGKGRESLDATAQKWGISCSEARAGRVCRVSSIRVSAKHILRELALY